MQALDSSRNGWLERKQRPTVREENERALLEAGGATFDTTLTDWVAAREAVRRWIMAGKLKPIEPKALFDIVWATTQAIR